MRMMAGGDDPALDGRPESASIYLDEPDPDGAARCHRQDCPPSIARRANAAVNAALLVALAIPLIGTVGEFH